MAGEYTVMLLRKLIFSPGKLMVNVVPKVQYTYIMLALQLVVLVFGTIHLHFDAHPNVGTKL